MLFAAYALIEGFKEIQDHNDFEVFVHGANKALDRATDLYDSDSPFKERKFLYPLSSAIFLIPLAMVPYPIAGGIFLAVKMACFIALIWGAIRCFESPSLPRGWGVWIAVVGLLVLLRPFQNDTNTGQINPIVAATGICGVLVMMRSRAWWWIGSILLAVSVALKLTTLLLLAVPFLHRRWGAFVATLAALVVLLVAVPKLWFGDELTAHLSERFNEHNSYMFLDARQTDEQTSVYEFAVFTYSMATLKGGPFEYDYEKRRIYTRVNGERKRFVVDEEDFDAQTLRLIWLGLSLVIGAGFLLWRHRLFSGRATDWTWDLAALCVFVILLSPVVRKAHLVILIAPVLWILCRVAARWAGGTPPWRDRKWAIFAGGTAAMLLIADDLIVPLPGLFVMPYHPGMMFAALAVLGMLHYEAKLAGSGGDELAPNGAPPSLDPAPSAPTP